MDEEPSLALFAATPDMGGMNVRTIRHARKPAERGMRRGGKLAADALSVPEFDDRLRGPVEAGTPPAEEPDDETIRRMLVAAYT